MNTRRKARRAIGPTTARCYECDWTDKANGGQVGRERVIHNTDVHVITTGHEAAVTTTRNIIIRPDE